MPSSPNELLGLANTLNGLGSEVAYRAAVSRSYYAVLHHANEIISLKLPLTTALFYTGGTHEIVHKKLMDGKTLQWRSLAYQLNDFKKERVEADYFLDAEILEQDALDAHIKAQNIMKELDDI